MQRDSIGVQAVKRMPIVYSAILGLLCRYFNIQFSEPIMEAIHLIAGAAIPLIMLVLGMQLATISLKKMKRVPHYARPYHQAGYFSCDRMALTLILPVDDMVKQIMIVVAAMPSAANTTMYALQY